MSCHVMSCRHYCIEFLKKSFSKTFLFIKIIYKYFAGFLACIVNGLYEDEVQSNPLSTDCHASCQRHAYGVEARNDKSKLHCHYEGNARDKVGQSPSNLFSGLLRIGNARNDNKIKVCINAICSDYKNVQFDKFQRFLSVIYKKFITKGDLNYVKSKNNF